MCVCGDYYTPRRQVFAQGLYAHLAIARNLRALARCVEEIRGVLTLVCVFYEEEKKMK